MASAPQTVISRQTSTKGFALIVSNDYCTTPQELNLSTLTGTRKDAEQMAAAFRALDIVTISEHNMTRPRLMQLVHETSQCTNYPRDSVCIAFVFSGHGFKDNHLYMQDGKKVKLEHIVEKFLPRNAPGIGNIPKLFFIDACRGDQEMHSITVPKGVAGVNAKGGKSISLEVPAEGNYLLAYSTMPCYRSYESKGEGGIWMTTLASKLLVAADRGESIEDILTAVNEDMMQLYQSPEWKTHVQQPEKISRLNRRVYLGLKLVQKQSPKKTKDTSSSGAIKSLPASKTGLPPMAAPAPTLSLPASIQDFRKTTGSQPKTPPPSKQPSGTSLNDSPKTLLSREEKTTPTSKPPKRKSSARALPQLSGDTPKRKLESYCEQAGKPSPKYSYSRISAKSFEGSVYVAQTFGWVAGDKRPTKAEAEEVAAAKLLEKLGY